MQNLTWMLLSLALAGCSSPEPRPEPAAEPPPAILVTLDEQESQLSAAFNQHSDQAQLVVILSPT